MRGNRLGPGLLLLIALALVVIALLPGKDPAECEAGGKTWQACTEGG